jgi:hypothetical protein
MIFSTDRAFAALFNNGSIVSWGDEHYGGKIPGNILSKLQPVKMIISEARQFTAVCKNRDSNTK